MTTFRCAVASADLAEPLAGTASVVRSFLLVQQAGPWGPDALKDSRLREDVVGPLQEAADRAGVRVLLIRRPGRAQPPGIRVFAAHNDPVTPWMETAVFDDPLEVLDLDLARLRRGVTLGLEHATDPVLCVCTHGAHDVCCAERGRPVAAALAVTHPELTWECSHIGGDRFAGNMLVLPHGFYYGRADAESGPVIAQAHLSGHVALDHYRGRAGQGFATQAAEWHLRSHLGLTRFEDLEWVSQHADQGRVEVRFTVVGRGEWTVHLRTAKSEPRRITCGSTRPGRALEIHLETITGPDGVAAAAEDGRTVPTGGAAPARTAQEGLAASAAGDGTDDVYALLRADLRVAMRTRDRSAVSVLRYLIAAIDNAGAVSPPDDASPPTGAIDDPDRPIGVGTTDVPRKELDRAAMLALLEREADDLRRAIADHDEGGRTEVAASLQQQLAIVVRYLPEPPA